jgi:hypothetical protein
VYDLATASQNCSTGSWICSEGSTKIREIILFNVISKSEKYNRDLKKDTSTGSWTCSDGRI